MIYTQLQVHFAEKTLPTFTKLLHFQVHESSFPISIIFKDNYIITLMFYTQEFLPACNHVEQ